MKHYFSKAATLLTVCCLFVCLAGCSKYKYEEVKGDLSGTRIYTLRNGMKVYLSVNKEEPRIQTFIAVRTGSKNDPAETTGLAHYLEHLMFKGTSKFGVSDVEAERPLLDDIEARYEKYRLLTDSEERRMAYHGIDSVSQLAAQYFIPNEYDKLMSAIGAEGTNAFTSNDVTCYVEDIPQNEVENWAKIQSDRFQNMVIRGFHTELEAVYEEYNIHLSSDVDKMVNAVLAKLFPNHPYGTQTTIGTQDHLKNPSITNIKNYFKKWYVPNNIAICMAGDLDPDKVVAVLDKYFGQWQKGDDVEQPTFGVLPELTSPSDTTVLGLEAESLWLGYRFEKAASLQCDTLEVVQNMLSNGTAGMLDLDINQQMKMLGAQAMAETLMDHSLFILAGSPREDQSLDEVRSLLIDEIEKLKKGEFSDDLLPSVVNNMKLDYYNALENNRARTMMYLDAFINGIPWEQKAKALDRIEGMTKQQIVDFANRHFNQNYVAVYKRQAVDPTQKKIDKPQITPIPTNRDLVSDFVKEIQASKVDPIEPRFVDFKNDLVFGNADSLPYVYVQNTLNGRFQLAFRFDFGEESDLRYKYAGEYLSYLGTDSLSPTEVQQQFYKLACSYAVNTGSRHITITLNGLSENMSEALQLLEHLLQHARMDEMAFRQYAFLREKARQDNKHDQQVNFNYLLSYGLYGTYNAQRNDFTIEQLASTNPQELLDLLKNIGQYAHTVLYYGPMSEKELSATLLAGTSSLCHPQGELLPPPALRHYTLQPTPANEVVIAPYDAKNIYMRMYHNEQRQWNADEAAVQALFNEYYGGGMNTIVFQELREARGLAYNAYAAYISPSYKDMPEFFFTHIITQNDKMMDCLKQFHAILDTIPQSEASFQIAKDALSKRLASQRTTKFGLINAWIAAKEKGIDFDLNKKIYEELPGITLADIVRFEQEQMARKTYRYIILGDEKDLDMKGLEQYGPIQRVTTEQIFGY